MFPSRKDVKRLANDKATKKTAEEYDRSSKFQAFENSIAPELKQLFQSVAKEHIKIKYKIRDYSEPYTIDPWDNGAFVIGNTRIIDIYMPNLVGSRSVYLNARFHYIFQDYAQTVPQSFDLFSNYLPSTYGVNLETTPDIAQVVNDIKKNITDGFNSGGLGTIYRELDWIFKYSYFLQTVKGVTKLE